MAKTEKETKVKAKAARYPVTQLVITGAWKRVFSSGKNGFFGQALDPSTGQKFQIIGAVEIAQKG